MSSVTPPYPYPATNAEYINLYKLFPSDEAGFLNQTIGVNSYIPNTHNSTNSTATPPFGLPTSPREQKRGRVAEAFGSGTAWYGGKADDQSEDELKAQASSKQLDATMIYYLLTPDSYQGRMHSNAYPHFHIHNAGRALYTLIKPPSTPNELPEIHRIVMGQNVTEGEVTQLLVPAGWWKASEIPEEDLLLLDAPGAGSLKDRIGALVTEIVVPGWVPDQHAFLTEENLKAMWNDKSGWEVYRKYLTAGTSGAK